MATQTVEFLAVYGQTLTAKLYAVGSDTLVQTASAVTEQTNRVGVYRATFTDAAAGEYELHVATSGGVPVARWYVTLTLTTATFASYDGPTKLAAITHTGARIPSVTLVDTTTTNTDMRGTNNALLATSYAAPLSPSETRSAIGLASANLDTQLADIPTVAEFEARTLTTANYANTTNQTAIKAVTDKLNTGLVADGAVYQFTANMLELAPAGGGGAGDASQTTLLQVQTTVDGIASSLSGVPITATGRIADGGTISLYCGDDLRVRSGTQLTLTVTDAGGSIYSRLNTIGTGNLAFGASRRGLPVSAISGSIASLTSVGSGASQTVRIVIEIDNAGGSLQPAEDYEWQIESEQTQGSEIDQLVEMAGILILRRRMV